MVDYPSTQSFESQLLHNELMLQEWTNRRNYYRDNGYTYNDTEVIMHRFEKKIIVLKDLIKKHGPKPCDDGYFIATVYGDKPNTYNHGTYQTNLRASTFNGYPVYHEQNTKYTYLPDGSGKYVYSHYYTLMCNP